MKKFHTPTRLSQPVVSILNYDARIMQNILYTKRENLQDLFFGNGNLFSCLDYFDEMDADIFSQIGHGKTAILLINLWTILLINLLHKSYDRAGGNPELMVLFSIVKIYSEFSLRLLFHFFLHYPSVIQLFCFRCLITMDNQGNLTRILYLRISWYLKYNVPSQIESTWSRDKPIKIITHSYNNTGIIISFGEFPTTRRKVINDTRKCEIFGKYQSVALIQGRSLFE